MLLGAFRFSLPWLISRPSQKAVAPSGSHCFARKQRHRSTVLFQGLRTGAPQKRDSHILEFLWLGRVSCPCSQWLEEAQSEILRGLPAALHPRFFCSLSRDGWRCSCTEQFTAFVQARWWGGRRGGAHNPCSARSLVLRLVPPIAPRPGEGRGIC